MHFRKHSSRRYLMSLTEIFKESYWIKKTDDSSEEIVFCETCQLYQRVLLAIVTTVYTSTLEQMTLITRIVILIGLTLILWLDHTMPKFIFCIGWNFSLPWCFCSHLYDRMVISDPRHTVLKSHRSKMSVIYM